MSNGQPNPQAVVTIPSPGEQIRFLGNIQRLLAEGLFVSSYKFALLHALADLAVLHGDDTGAALDLDTSDIATKFVEIYWRQCRPFRVENQNTGLILRQSNGKPAVILSKIAATQGECTPSLFRLKQQGRGEWSKLVGDVASVVREMPLWKLQTVGSEQLEFLYANIGSGTRINLKPGVAYCLRAFYDLIRDLIEAVWVRFVQKLNAPALGTVTDLGTFLFGQERACLDAYRPILLDVQKGVCLYCNKSLREKSQVDHFIPWSRYPADLGHNFVLAHERCNNAKSDYLAAEKHLAAWTERNDLQRDELQSRLQGAALPCDLPASLQIAKWVYSHTERAKGQVWVKERVLQHLGSEWRRFLPAL